MDAADALGMLPPHPLLSSRIAFDAKNLWSKKVLKRIDHLETK